MLTKRVPGYVTATVRLTPEMLDHLKGLARVRAVEEARAVSYSELVRDAVNRLYPLPDHDPLMDAQ